MKSIIEEASSIVKAIEAAWIRAEKPQEFSVKIFEEPEKNFFGMVTKSAKIALIFKNVEKKQSKDAGSKHKAVSESPIFNTHTKEYRKEQPRRETAPREHREEREPQEYRETRERREPRERQEREHQERREHREPRERQERQETREQREPRERQDRQEAREQREPRERNERREQREPRERQEREPRESRDRYENREQERREPREPMVRELMRKESAPKPAQREQEQLSFVAHEIATPSEQQQAAPEKIFWTEEMISTTRAWVETLLKNMNCSDIAFNLEPKRYYLTITFDKPVRQTKALEQQLFRSCAYLIMQMLRTKMKKQYRGLKVVLSSPTPSQDAA